MAALLDALWLPWLTCCCSPGDLLRVTPTGSTAPLSDPSLPDGQPEEGEGEGQGRDRRGKGKHRAGIEQEKLKHKEKINASLFYSIFEKDFRGIASRDALHSGEIQQRSRWAVSGSSAGAAAGP